MLATRASTARTALRLRVIRDFATVVDSAGYKVATIDHGQPTSAVTLLVKAGSRYETKPGVAHALKHFAFKSTAKTSALATVRSSELYGGVLSSSLSREYLALTAEFLRGDESHFVDLLTSFITSAKFTRHELEEYVAPVIESESTAASNDPETRALEIAHSLAFRTGLGSPLFANPHHAVSAEDIKSYASSVFGKGNLVVLGTGISQETLSKLVHKAFPTQSSSSSTSTAAPIRSTPSTYFGGETRSESHGGPQTVFIGFGTTATSPSPTELSALSAYLSPEPSIKWSQGLSPISGSIPIGTSVQTVLLPYSDATLFGLLVQGKTADGVKEAGKVVVKALKNVGAPGGIKAEELKKAAAKAKFTSASAIDGRDGVISTLGAKVLAGSESSLDSTLASFDKLTVASFSKSVSALLKGKPTYVAVGDVQALPYADELGL